MNLYQFRAPSIRFFLANGWESTNLKERNQAVRALGVAYNAHVMEAILTTVAPALGWR